MVLALAGDGLPEEKVPSGLLKVWDELRLRGLLYIVAHRNRTAYCITGQDKAVLLLARDAQA